VITSYHSLENLHLIFVLTPQRPWNEFGRRYI
jgi:hypothetical protein